MTDETRKWITHLALVAMVVGMMLVKIFHGVPADSASAYDMLMLSLAGAADLKTAFSAKKPIAGDKSESN